MGTLPPDTHISPPSHIASRSRRWQALAAAVLLAAAAVACRESIAPTPDPTLAALSSQVASQGTFVAYLATQVGALARPTTPSPDEPTPYLPITGSVLLEEGRCCVMGLVGNTVEVQAAFAATSPFAEVSEMRVLARATPANLEDFADVGWEQFQPSKTFLAVAAMNWLGFYVSVQYRDSLGHLSPVFVDDVSIEGFIPAPT